MDNWRINLFHHHDAPLYSPRDSPSCARHRDGLDIEENEISSTKCGRKGRSELVRTSESMVRCSIMKTLNGFERRLLLSGLLLVCVYAAARMYGVVYSRAMVREFWRNQAANLSRPGSSFRPNPGIPDSCLWPPKRVDAHQTSLTTNLHAPLAVLNILSIGIEVPVLERTDDLTLNRGVGHIDGTPAPGKDGNIGIAGHRDGFFRGLKDVHLGDYFDLYTEKGNTRHVVDEIRIVPSEGVSVLAPHPRSSITLVT